MWSLLCNPFKHATPGGEFNQWIDYVIVVSSTVPYMGTCMLDQVSDDKSGFYDNFFALFCNSMMTWSEYKLVFVFSHVLLLATPIFQTKFSRATS